MATEKQKKRWSAEILKEFPYCFCYSFVLSVKKIRYIPSTRTSGKKAINLKIAI